MPTTEQQDGAALLQAGKSEEALPLLEAELKQRVLAERGTDYRLLSNLAVCHRNLQHLELALDWAKAAVNAAGGDVAAGVWNNLGMILEDFGGFAEATAAYQVAVALDPKSQLFALNLAYGLMRFQHFEEAWPVWLSSRLMQTWVPVPGIPIWEPGEDITEKRLLVHCDGGYGDAMMFARFFRPLWLKRITVKAVCPPEILRLYRLCPWVGALPLGTAIGPADYDYQCALMDLPALIGVKAARDLVMRVAPFERKDRLREKRAFWAKTLKRWRRPRIGLCWRAEEQTVQRKHRSVPLIALAPLLARSATWVSLCPDGREEAEESGLFHLDPTALLKHWTDTAALLMSLDLVITVDTAVAHLAGSLKRVAHVAGSLKRPVWILVPHRSDWKWFLDTDRSPLYPTARLFRQNDPLLWDGTVARLVETFSEEIEADPRWKKIGLHPSKSTAALKRWRDHGAAGFGR